jgi:CheY-like chemotaxis protein
MLRVTSESIGNQLLIRVSDSGPGIPTENLQRVFNPFFTTKPVGEGTGLGLSISDGIVREHGGRIRVESRCGHGAVFTIELPYVAPPLPKVPAVDAAAPASLASRRLLVVEDEPAIRNAIATYFRSLGHAVDVVGTGREAIARATATSYDALLLDLRLPDIGGDQVLAELELIAREPERVVFITGDTQNESTRRALDALGRPVISKPFLLDALATAVLAEPEPSPLI